MRGLNRVRWVFAILAFFWGALFLYGALDFYDRGALGEMAVAGTIGALACLVGWFLAPRQGAGGAA